MRLWIRLPSRFIIVKLAWKSAVKLRVSFLYLNLDADNTMNIYRNYLHLSNSGDFIVMHKELNQDLPIVIHLYKNLKVNGLATRGFINYFINNYQLHEELTQEVKELTDYLVKL